MFYGRHELQDRVRQMFGLFGGAAQPSTKGAAGASLDGVVALKKDPRSQRRAGRALEGHVGRRQAGGPMSRE